MDLGDRIKEYEHVTRFKLMRRGYTIIRVDGKAFHTYTKGLKTPFDKQFIEDMNFTAMALCKEIQGAKLAYVQSDEITIVITDFDQLETNAWFDNTLQKMCSVSASIATSTFNHMRMIHYFSVDDDRNNIPYGKHISEHFEEDYKWQITDHVIRMGKIINYFPMNYKPANFDSRVFQVPTKQEAINTLIWRQKDATRNSIQSAAYALYSQKQMHGKSSEQLQEMIFQKGINWNDYPIGQKRGRIILKEEHNVGTDSEPVLRSRWTVVDPPIFTQDREFLENLIPNNQ